MPRVKIDYVVSFSNEDSDNPASNLLSWDVSKKRWLCTKGEPSCSVVLQLTRAVKVNAVHVGAHHSALVEVLVGRSEKPNEPFQVLVPSCVFLSPAESRRAEAAERVRSFGAEQLAAPARAQRWDRVRLVCSQPYNKHCKYGLNFVHIYTPEGAEPAAAAAPALPPRLSLAEAASSDEEFTPGELFARHRSSQGPAQAASGVSDSGAQIRQATSQALKNISDSATKLVKTPIAKHGRPDRADAAPSADRRRDDLMYTRDDDKPHAKIDQIVRRHRDDRSREDAGKPRSDKLDRKKDSRNESACRDAKKQESRKERDRHEHKDRDDRTPKDDRKARQTPDEKSRDEPSTSHESRTDERKRSRDDQRPRKDAGVLRGVVCALSGYVHPRRAALRDLALRLGARVERDWTPSCNHLICAFPNTPKLKQVRAGAGGAAVPAARGEWLEECARRRRRVPWRWFATEPHHALAVPDDSGDDADPSPPADEEDCDTDDEIEKALRQQKKRRTDIDRRRDSSPDTSRRHADDNAGRDTDAEVRDDAGRDADADEPADAPRDTDADASGASDVMFVRDERVQGNITVQDTDDEDTTEDERDKDAEPARIDPSAALPELFEGATFTLDASVARQAARLARYVRAYGGLLLEESQLDPDSSVDYVVSAAWSGAARACVRPAWLWRCHAARARCDVDAYLLAPGD